MTSLTTEKVTTTTGDPGKAAHIVFVPEDAGMTPQALVLAARVEGFHVIALCGYTWVPQQNPAELPVCQRCLEIYQQPGDHRDDREDLPEA